MKKTILVFLTMLTTLSLTQAQNNEGHGYSNGWGGTKIIGEGAIEKETRDVANFTGVQSGISADIYVKQAPTFKVTVEGQKNILAHLKTELKNGSLKIGFEKGYNVQYKKALKVYIEAPSFELLTMSGSGNVISENNLSGTKLTVDISGSGDFNLPNLAFKSLKLDISGSGNIKAGGTSETVELHISGSGDVKASNLTTQKAICNVSGSGNISCNVKQALEAYVSGSGDIRYGGSPESVKTRVTGSGDIKAE